MKGVRRLTSEQEWVGNLRMFKPNGKRKNRVETNSIRITTIKNREPHRGCRAVMVIFIQ